MSCAMYHLSHVTFHLSPTPTATATDPPPSNFPTINQILVFVILVIHSSTKILQSTQGTALCSLHPEYCTPYPWWLQQILGMSHPD